VEYSERNWIEASSNFQTREPLIMVVPRRSDATGS